MHILFICHEYPPSRLIGGIGIFVRNISRGLVRAGHAVTVAGLYALNDDSDKTGDDGIRVIRIGAGRSFLKLGWYYHRRRLFSVVRKLIDEADVDLIETSDHDAGFWLMPAFRVPKVVRLNGGEVYFRMVLGERLSTIRRYVESASLRRADAIASVSRYTWQKTRELFDLSQESCEILPNPVDLVEFSPADSAPSVRGRIVYTGTIIRKKGVVELFRALPRVFDEAPEAHIVCVGADARDTATGLPSTVQLLLRDLPVRFHSRVTFTGKVPHREIVSHLRSANVCVLPSHLEAFPNTWLEAMACARPVVASRTGSGPEVIEDGVSGLLCDPEDDAGLADKVLNLLRDSSLADRLGTAARARVSANFSLEIMLEKNLVWYKKVCDAYGDRGRSDN